VLTVRPGHRCGPAARDAAALDVAALAPAGHYLALRVSFNYPLTEVNALPGPWVEHYRSSGLMLSDPVFRWVHAEVGARRWSAMTADDPKGVLARAASHGLRFGVAVSVLDPGRGGQRSWGSFARSDREFDDTEAALLEAHVQARHRAHCPPTNVTQAEIDALRLLKAGQRLKQIAWSLGVTEGAVKQRLRSARGKLDARTAAEAISRAASLGMI
jgi:LuxR family transcriptional regulator